MEELKVFSGTYAGKKYKKNTIFEYFAVVPAEAKGEMGIIVEHDGRNEPRENAMLRLSKEGKAPYCVFLGVKPGRLPTENGVGRYMRMDDYDLLCDEYANFIVEELIPHVTKEYKLKISKNPDWHMAEGGSSGGISAFVMAWFRNDYFRRAYISSPSFLSMGRGNEMPHLIKKTETKPIRVYEEYSENEPNDYFGSSYAVDIEAERAFRFANYDFECRFFPGEGHCSRYYNEDEAYISLGKIWENYEEPITVKGLSPRVADVIDLGSKWKKAKEMPKRRVTRKLLSSDKQMVYFGDRNDDVVCKTAKGTDAKYLHGMLNTLPTVFPKGAIDMAIDEEDRLYVLTAIGIQCVRSFGLIDVILNLPRGEAPEMIAIKENDLYVKTDKSVWVRKIRHKAAGRKATAPKHADYYD